MWCTVGRYWWLATHVCQPLVLTLVVSTIVDREGIQICSLPCTYVQGLDDWAVCSVHMYIIYMSIIRVDCSTGMPLCPFKSFVIGQFCECECVLSNIWDRISLYKVSSRAQKPSNKWFLKIETISQRSWLHHFYTFGALLGNLTYNNQFTGKVNYKNQHKNRQMELTAIFTGWQECCACCK